ncbi:kinesin-like protein KIN-14P [Papaver somniferum]|uniref:kinesin-like protein KIN-14P n=1 Tax=Papaver somniferum TaxID=3469 RepID=UPI000E6FA637|nr:kinesin-like protein KIN-14P [Papaver somniferum]
MGTMYAYLPMVKLGQGKTYTMTGPDASSRKDWGINYCALNDLFQISQNRRSSFLYEVGVQVVEIYNGQVHDLLQTGGVFGKISFCGEMSSKNGIYTPRGTTRSTPEVCWRHPINTPEEPRKSAENILEELLKAPLSWIRGTPYQGMY